MKTKLLIIEVPEDCFYVIKNGEVGVDLTCMQMVSAIASGKEAIAWDTSKLVMTSKGGDIATMSNPKMNGKPVTLYAVEVEK